MNNKLIYILQIVAVAIMCWSCGSKHTDQTQNCRQKETEKLQEGDLIFVGIEEGVENDSSIASAIVSSTRNSHGINNIHVGIIHVEDTCIFVVDATTGQGVSKQPLNEFIKNNRNRTDKNVTFSIKRLIDTTGVTSYVSKSMTFIGRSYDYEYSSTNQDQYCSELVWNSYVRSDGTHLFSSYPMNFKNEDGSYPLYWIELFDSMGIPIPQGEMGTNPNRLSNESNLENVNISL